MTSSAIEPQPHSFRHAVHCYFAATRPAFLSATLVACLLGLAGAAYTGVSIQWRTAGISIALALLVHASVNVLNDYFDALNGSDAHNTQRIYPFTGGSRLIQNGVLSQQQTLYFGYALLAVVVAGGIWLTTQTGLGLFAIGLIGTLVGWAYSASPLRLNSRGLGELCVWLGFVCLVSGADYVQRHTFAWQPLVVGLPYALLATNLLYINQYPDRAADAFAHKRTLVVRLPLAHSIWLYLAFAGLAYLWVVWMVLYQQLPLLALVSTLPLVFSWRAFLQLRQFAATPTKLRPAILATLASMLGHGVLLAIVLFLGKA